MIGFTFPYVQRSSAVRAGGNRVCRFCENKNAKSRVAARSETVTCQGSGKKLGLCKPVVQKRSAIARAKPLTAKKAPRFVNSSLRYRSRKKQPRRILASPIASRVLCSVEKVKSVRRD